MTEDEIIERVAIAAFFEYAKELPVRRDGTQEPTPEALWADMGETTHAGWRRIQRAAI